MDGLRVCILGMLSVLSTAGFADIFTVTNTSGIVIPGSLRHTVGLTNANPGLDEIRFNLPQNAPMIIELQDTAVVVDPVIIDGSSQPGFVNAPIIRVQSPPALVMNQPSSQAIKFDVGSDGSLLSDISITAPETTNINEGCANLLLLRSSFNIMYNCRVGVDFVPTIEPDYGIAINSADNNTITHSIVGNVRYGMLIGYAHNTWIFDNAIGTDFTGTQDYGCNSGIAVIRSNGVIIGPIGNEPGNIIANNGDHAIVSGFPPLADEYSNVSIRKNRIYNHSDVVFKVGVNTSAHLPNDSNDSDFLNQMGPQNHAVIDFAGRGDGQFTVVGTLDSTPNTPFVIDFFANDVLTSLLYGEGQYYLGSANVTSDSNGDAFFSVSFPDTLSPSSKWISSLTSRAVGGATSQFSLAVEATDMISYSETSPDLDLAWVPSGLDSGPESPVEPTSPDDVDVAKVPGALQTIVRPSLGRYRIAGWHHPSVVPMVSNDPFNIYIGKFYITASNPLIAPLNTVPNFRIRLENEGAMLASATFQYAATGIGGTAHEPFYDGTNNPARELRAGGSLRPSANPAKPSLYRVQFAPLPVPAALGSNIGATFESFATPNTADGVLSLTELTIAKYPVNLMLGEAESIFSYSVDTDYQLEYGASSPYADFVPGKFNAEADFRPGRRQAIDLESEVGPSQLAQVFETANDGTIIDTDQTPANKFGVGLFSITSNDPVQAPRVEVGKNYVAQFAVSSDMPTSSALPGAEVQGGVIFEMQTGLGAVIHRTELTGPVNIGILPVKTKQIASQILPGIGSLNPFLLPFSQVGETGGLYFVFMPTPLDPDIRADVGGNLGVFGAEPGPGVNLSSARDISLGVIGLESPNTLRLSPTLTVPYAQPNRAKVRVLGATLFEMPPIDDGGYAY